VSSCCSVTFLRELFLAGGFEPEAAIIERRRRGADRQVLAAKFVKFEAMEPTHQTTTIDVYLQTVGDKLAAHAQRKLPYRFH
jgi:hypothetical protein